ncbi:MAG: hypothetical protein PVG01_05080, partial [Desulfobacterales bacterium]
PGALRNFIRKACAREPGKRYQNISEVLTKMKPLAAEYGLANGGPYEPKRKMRMFYLVYGDEETKELTAAMDDFNIRMQRIGVELKAGDLINF